MTGNILFAPTDFGKSVGFFSDGSISAPDEFLTEIDPGHGILPKKDASAFFCEDCHEE